MDPREDLASLKQDLTRSLTSQVEGLVASFVESQSVKFDVWSREAAFEKSRLDQKQRQVEDASADVAVFVSQEVAALAARFGQPVEDGESDLPPLARLHHAWRRGSQLFDEVLRQRQEQHEAALAEQQAERVALLAAKDAELEQTRGALAELQDRKLSSEAELLEEKAAVERHLQRRSQELEQVSFARDAAQTAAQSTSASAEEAQSALARQAYEQGILDSELDTLRSQHQALKADFLSMEARAQAREQELKDMVQVRERSVADMKKAMQEQETELLQKVERVQQYVKERQAGALQAEKMQAVAQHDTTKLHSELRRLASDRDAATGLVLQAEEKTRAQASHYEAKLAKERQRVSDLDGQVRQVEKENRDKNHELLERREAEYQSKVCIERQREQDRTSALVRRKEQEITVKDGQLQALRARVAELEAR